MDPRQKDCETPGQDFELPPTSWKNEVWADVVHGDLATSAATIFPAPFPGLGSTAEPGAGGARRLAWHGLHQGGTMGGTSSGISWECILSERICAPPKAATFNRDDDTAGALISDKMIWGGFENWLNFAISCWVGWV